MARLELLRVDPDATRPGLASAWETGLEAVMPGVHVDSDGELDGRLTIFDFAGARLWSFESHTQTLTRRRPSVGPFRPMALIQLAGWTKFCQFGETEELHPGDFRFLDAAKPLSLEKHGDSHLLYLEFPSSLLPAGHFQIAARSPRVAGWTMDQSFVDSVVNLWDSAESLLPREHATALGALVALAHISSPFRNAEEESATPIRVTRAMAFIEHNLGEAWLTPTAVAQAQNVSRRYLDDLFLQRGFRVEGWIWERRLQRAAEELRLYGQVSGSARRTILQISLDLGFKNPSHFTRSFSARFGASPREYRNRMPLN